MSSFAQLVRRVRGSDWRAPAILLALDPGETTGWAVFHEELLAECGQLSTKELSASAIKAVLDLIVQSQPTYVVTENYKVYSWKTKEHSWSALHTPRLVGAIETLCILHNIPLRLQMASQAKMFCTNERLTTWGYYQPTRRHAMDAIRHACHTILFARSLGGLRE